MFDVYGTLLRCLPAAPEPEKRWSMLWQKKLGRNPTLSLEEFIHTAELICSRQMTAARALGISHPETDWLDVLSEALPELASGSLLLSGDSLIWRHEALCPITELADGAGPVLQLLRKRHVRMGIVANAQPYVYVQLEAALRCTGRRYGEVFSHQPHFVSSAWGFAKPDPYVFQTMSTQLRRSQIQPECTMMVGDSVGEDIEPARRFGWRTWHLSSGGNGQDSGDWRSLYSYLEVHAQPLSDT